MAEPRIRVYFEGGVWIRELVFAKAGDCHAGHTHSHDHMTLISRGPIAITVEGIRTEVTDPHVVVITKGKRHDLTALIDGAVAYCVASEADVTTGPN